MIRILHFADAHIDMAAQGRHDPETGLPVRVLDFLKALDTIVDTAIAEHVDLVIFAGDAYKDRTPVPTFQREWGRRMMRLSQAQIPTLLLVGNHDLSPAVGRAHTLQEYETLAVPFIRVISRPEFLTPEQLWGLPLQLLAIPWVSRSALMAALGWQSAENGDVYQEMEARLTVLVQDWLNQLDPALPTVMTAHASVQGAVYGGERAVMLGNDLVLPGSMVRDPRLDYVALGHIHKAQNLNPGAHPPVIYPGSIERVDFGEAADEKGFVIAAVSRGKTDLDHRPLKGRSFMDRSIELTSHQKVMEQCLAVLPPASALTGAMVRLVITYPRDWEAQIDEAALRRHCESALEFHLVRRPQVAVSARLPGEHLMGLSPLELLALYWQNDKEVTSAQAEELLSLAARVIAAGDGMEGE
ncbi:MAG TPA: exonuclease SbcCD subunit D [Anaerolineaceae bacterium]|jgi:exonuclease SbcD|nr:exonuclease SbcCD subunit D [Anaerolineaceae bacterium]HOD03917.1 exonuclease SbcCD subunit D [Anaerolineaceae bacterium]HOG78300.1 exonuclease SbcCD subunit D [Anaerolineaceae bacterium]HQF62431.1 exonuclease SbcCD subunit D [Anaerolineaceae bacterium]HQH85630.1 exonuclease SbcCD subunit D [Anaerolineaceae bacterium]